MNIIHAIINVTDNCEYNTFWPKNIWEKRKMFHITHRLGEIEQSQSYYLKIPSPVFFYIRSNSLLSRPNVAIIQKISYFRLSLWSTAIIFPDKKLWSNQNQFDEIQNVIINDKKEN